MTTFENSIWLEHQGEGPIFATAIHAGHHLRGELLPLIALDEATRLREEDPYTDDWVKIVPGWKVMRRSRFEVDLNRNRDEAVYRSPEMAWGLQLWKTPLSDVLVNHSLQEQSIKGSDSIEIIHFIVNFDFLSPPLLFH